MAKIIIGLGERQKRMDIEIGDLLLILQESRNTHRLGILREIRSPETMYLEDGEMILREPFRIEGGRGIGGIANVPSYSDVKIGKIANMYKGPRDISNYLTQIGWKIHAEWIKGLSEKNPKLPGKSVMFYLPAQIARVEI